MLSTGELVKKKRKNQQASNSGSCDRLSIYLPLEPVSCPAGLKSVFEIGNLGSKVFFDPDVDKSVSIVSEKIIFRFFLGRWRPRPLRSPAVEGLKKCKAKYK